MPIKTVFLLCLSKLTPRLSIPSTLSSYPAVSSTIYTVLLSGKTIAPASGNTVIVTFMGEMSPLIVAETRELVKCSALFGMLINLETQVSACGGDFSGLYGYRLMNACRKENTCIQYSGTKSEKKKTV